MQLLFSENKRRHSVLFCKKIQQTFVVFPEKNQVKFYDNLLQHVKTLSSKFSLIISISFYILANDDLPHKLLVDNCGFACIKGLGNNLELPIKNFEFK